MAKRKIECIRCHRIRYEDRMVRIWVDSGLSHWSGIPTFYRCGAKSSCKAERKRWRKSLALQTGLS